MKAAGKATEVIKKDTCRRCSWDGIKILVKIGLSFGEDLSFDDWELSQNWRCALHTKKKTDTDIHRDTEAKTDHGDENGSYIYILKF